VGAAELARKSRRGYEELWNRRNTAVILEWVHPQYVGYYSSLPDPISGIAGFRSMYEQFIVAFPDLRIDILDLTANDSRVATRWRGRGTHLGDLIGWSATGRAVEFECMAIERYLDGLCIEEWLISDDLRVMRQIGGLPDRRSRGERLLQFLHRLRPLRRTSAEG
jgi:predicted ester cyclase